MSNWFFIALIAPVLWSIVNHIDKYLLSRYLKDRGVGAILIFSCLSSFLILPAIILVFHSQIFNFTAGYLFGFASLGFLSTIAFFFYLKAVDIEEVSIVIPLFQLMPVFGYFLSYLINGESLNTQQILASLLIIFGVIILSFEIDVENKLKLKKKILLFVILSSFLYALNDTLFKKIAISESFWITVFWQYIGLVLFGLIIMVLSKKFRQDFKDMIFKSNSINLSLNFLSEILYIAGNLCSNFAMLLAPVAIVMIISSYQPVFVFMIGIFMTMFFPKIITEKITTGHFFHKFISIIIIIIGSYLLFLASHY